MNIYDNLLAQMELEDYQGQLDRMTQPEPVKQSGALRRYVADPAISALKGAIGLPEAVVGIADIATGGEAGRLAEKVGYRPKEAKIILDDLYSPEQQEANKAVEEAEGFIPTIVEHVKNPSTVAHSIIESIPSMLGGAGVARQAMKVLPKLAPVVAGALGEGVISAGATAEQTRQATEHGDLSLKQSAVSAGSGALTGLFGLLGGKLAQRLGIADIDTLLAGGTAQGEKQNILLRIVKGAISEGAFEELPQSAQEQAAQNISLGRPWHEGVAEAAASGLMAGLAMGGGTGVISGSGKKQVPAKDENLEPQTSNLEPASIEADSFTAGEPPHPVVDLEAQEQPVLPEAPKGPLSRAAEAATANAIPGIGDIEAAPVTASVPPIQGTTTDELVLDEARDWAEGEIKAGKTHLMRQVREHPNTYAQRILDSFKRRAEVPIVNQGETGPKYANVSLVNPETGVTEMVTPDEVMDRLKNGWRAPEAPSNTPDADMLGSVTDADRGLLQSARERASYWERGSMDNGRSNKEELFPWLKDWGKIVAKLKAGGADEAIAGKIADLIAEEYAGKKTLGPAWLGKRIKEGWIDKWKVQAQVESGGKELEDLSPEEIAALPSTKVDHPVTAALKGKGADLDKQQGEAKEKAEVGERQGTVDSEQRIDVEKEKGPVAETEKELEDSTQNSKPKTQNSEGSYGDKNAVFTKDKADRAREILRKKLSQLNAGLDPEMIQAGIDLAGYHIEAGARSFTEYSKRMVTDLGEAISPFLKAFYLAVRNYPGFDNAGMDTEAQIESGEKAKIEEKTGLQDSQESDKLFNEDEFNSSVDGGVENERSESGSVAERSDVRGMGAEGIGQAGRADTGQGRTGAGADAEVLGTVPAADVAASDSDGDSEGTGSRPRREVRRSDSEKPEGGNVRDGRTGTSRTGLADDGNGGSGERRGDGARASLSLGDEPNLARSNYHISDPEKLVGGTPKVRFAKNRAAIEALQSITSEGRTPTPEELDYMAAYTGWGSFGQELFQGSWDHPRPKPEWEKEVPSGYGNTLAKKNWKSAQNSIINAHYTDPPTVGAMWELAARLGFAGGRILEPSIGIGNFFGLMPRNVMERSKLAGIELDTLTGGMAQILYPQANIQIKGYQESKTSDNFYDLIIGNWPFAKDGPADRRYRQISPSLHDYFFLKAIDQVRPGGLIIGVTSSGTMDKIGKLTRMELAKKGDLVAAFRLPSGAFKQYAGTDVVTDIIVLKKREQSNTDLAGSGWDGCR